MSVSGVGAPGYPTAGYDARKTERNVVGENFAKQVIEAAQTTGQISTAILHGSDEETGDIAICSGVDIENNSSITVYKTQDFDSDNPVYKVKTWDAAGNVTERMVDISKVDPKNCDEIDMFAYSSHLSATGECPDAQGAFMGAKSYHNNSDGSGSLFDKENWQEIVKDIMQMQYRAGNLEGYLHYKRFWDFLDK